MPEIISLGDDPRPYLNVNVMGFECEGLLDSGSSCTILGKDAVEIVKSLNLNGSPCNVAIKTADGTVHLALCRVDIPFRVENKIKVVPTLIIPSMAKHLILGIDFWKIFGISPTFEVLKNGCDEVEEISIEGGAEALAEKIDGVYSGSYNVTGMESLGNLSNEKVDYDRVELSDEQLKILSEVIESFEVTKYGKLGRTDILKHNINTGEAKPVVKRPYPVSPFIQKEVDLELNRMMEMGVIEPAKGEWANPMVIVRKPNGKIRMCLDARGLNAVTEKDRYPLPHIGRILGQIQATKYQSSIDLSDAFWQVPLDEESKAKTAFIVPGRGQFQFSVIPFGLCNSAQGLCRALDQCIGYDLEPRCFSYVDDIIITTPTFEEHVKILNEVSKRLKKGGFTISKEKSKFCAKELKYLGYIMDENGLSMDPDRISPILNIAPPKTLKELRRIIGMASWYRRFIKNFSDLVEPMTNLMKKENSKKFVWTPEADKALCNLKTALVSAPILCSPNFEEPFTIQTDASDVGIGAVLSQGVGNEERVIAYMSKKLLPAQRRYTTTERECLAVIEAIQHFKTYVEGSKFTVITDHASLIWLKNFSDKDSSSRLTRWALKLGAHDFEMVHRKGKLNVVADALSRFVESVEFDQTQDLDEEYLQLCENIRKFPEKYPSFYLKNGFVYKHCVTSDKLGLIETEWKMYVPAKARLSILKKFHDDPLGSHFGVSKTLSRIQVKYFWPKMANYVKNYVSTCEKCQLNKHSNAPIKVPMGAQKKTNGPWDSISVDFIGPLPRSKNGYCYILAIMDNFSKYCVLKPVRNANAKTLVNILESEIFLVYGVPSILVTDNGSALVSKLFKDLLKEYNVTINYNAFYHAQHNPTERLNQVVEASIRSFIEKDHKEWDVFLPKIACAIRTTKHDSTKFTPYVINFGKHMNLDGNRHIEEVNLELDNEQRIDRLNEIRNIVKSNLKESYEKYSKYYNLRAKMVSFAPGEIVRRKSFYLSSAPNNFCAKLANKYVKCRVREKLGASTYLLESLDGKVLGKYHANDLLKFSDRDQN